MAGKPKDLTGCKFGKITVISKKQKENNTKDRHVHWNCKCECGNTVVIRGDKLRSGQTQSCGCLVKEKSSNHMKVLNEQQWKDEEFKQMQSDKMKKRWQDDTYRKEYSKKMGGEASHFWKGGINSISNYLHSLTTRWAEETKRNADYTCELSGKRGGNLHTHHLYPFNCIVVDAHEKHGISIKRNVKDYTEEELHNLREYVIAWHMDGSNAVVLCSELHLLFHTMYGFKDNTKEQFEKFRQDYKDGKIRN